MILIGLGSNLGDRLLNLRTALSHLQNHSEIFVKTISPVYYSEALLTENAPRSWNSFYLNAVIEIDTKLSPHDLLHALQRIEETMGREKSREKWAPRIIDLDVLTFNDVVFSDDVLTIPHPEWNNRPFVLWPMSDVCRDSCAPNNNNSLYELGKKWGSRFNGNAPFKTRQLPHRLETPIIIGILNLTPDSFSDGGLYKAPEQALFRAKKLIEEGGEYLDLGAESTRPNAALIDAKTDWERIKPVLEIIQKSRDEFLFPPKISLDTRHVSTLEKALDYGFDVVNKIDGYHEKNVYEFLKSTGKPAILMHQCSVPADGNITLDESKTPIQHVCDWFQNKGEQLEQNGVDPAKIWLDPGIGFGKKPHQNLEILNHLERLERFKKPILIGHSRKSFFSLFDDKKSDARDLHTAIVSAYLAKKSVNYLRVHDVESTRLAVNISLRL